MYAILNEAEIHSGCNIIYFFVEDIPLCYRIKRQ